MSDLCVLAFLPSLRVAPCLLLSVARASLFCLSLFVSLLLYPFVFWRPVSACPYANCGLVRVYVKKGHALVYRYRDVRVNLIPGGNVGQHG